MDDGEAQARGARAADLLNNDLLKEAFKTLEEAYIRLGVRPTQPTR
jgi:hypothetical protein